MKFILHIVIHIHATIFYIICHTSLLTLAAGCVAAPEYILHTDRVKWLWSVRLRTSS